MVGLSKLYLGQVEASDALRYGRRSARLPSHLLQFSEDKRPVVVWNCTQACNLDCRHCYASAGRRTPSPDELSTEEGLRLLDSLADFGVPVVLFSGGEPLMRTDLDILIRRAVSLGMRAVLSTNGTLIDCARADTLRELGLSYVGVSLDGLENTHDAFRGRQGAFDEALNGLRACRDRGTKVGLRFTITQGNCRDIGGIFDLIQKEMIPRVCFYHFVPTGQASRRTNDSLSHEQTRQTLDLIIERTQQLADAGRKPEVLTVANHADGPYLYLRLIREGNMRAADNALALLKMNGGNSSGRGIACINWDGTLFPDQFWRSHALGNVRTRSFNHIWSDSSHPILDKLRQYPRPVRGRCEQCGFLSVCNGNLRARAEALTGDPWACDPACYLSDDEIDINLSEAGSP